MPFAHCCSPTSQAPSLQLHARSLAAGPQPRGALGLSCQAVPGRRQWLGCVARLCLNPVALCSRQLVQDRSRAEKYLCQSLPYLESPQAALQELAVRFIGEPQALGALSVPQFPGPSDG